MGLRVKKCSIVLRKLEEGRDDGYDGMEGAGFKDLERSAEAGGQEVICCDCSTADMDQLYVVEFRDYGQEACCVRVVAI